MGPDEYLSANLWAHYVLVLSVSLSVQPQFVKYADKNDIPRQSVKFYVWFYTVSVFVTI